MKFIRVFLFSITALFSITTHAQDSCQLQISLLTCSPGQELYSIFGHTAIRVKDNSGNTDVVFNYGTFDDSDPNFYLKFTQGIMVYALSAYPMSDFLDEYNMENRGVIEQALDLSCAEKQQLFIALQVNATESKRYYNYYFKEDNCTTRAKEMVQKNAVTPVTFKNILPASIPTYRQLIHSYLNRARQYWSKFGIDILLGSNLDKQVSNEQAMFLPDLLLQGFDSAQVNNHSLVKNKQVILNFRQQQPGASLVTPATVCWFLLFLVAAASFSKIKAIQYWLKFFDVLFFFLLGLLGVLILVLWAIRIDDVCRNNFNLLWALPTHLPMAFLYFSKKRWVTNYFRVVLGISLLTAIAWSFLPQEMNVAIIPLLLIVIVRSYFRGKKK